MVSSAVVNLPLLNAASPTLGVEPLVRNAKGTAVVVNRKGMMAAQLEQVVQQPEPVKQVTAKGFHLLMTVRHTCSCDDFFYSPILVAEWELLV